MRDKSKNHDLREHVSEEQNRGKITPLTNYPHPSLYGSILSPTKPALSKGRVL